jgi:hypothetical protein
LFFDDQVLGRSRDFGGVMMAFLVVIVERTVGGLIEAWEFFSHSFLWEFLLQYPFNTVRS